MKRQAKDGPRPIDEAGRTSAQAYRERIHRQAEGDEHNLEETHSGEIPSEPAGNDVTRVLRILPFEQEVVRAVKGDKAFRMASHRIKPLRGGDGHDVVLWSVHDEQGEMQV